MTSKRDGFSAELTETGAAIINYFADLLSRSDLGDAIERGAGHFVDDALDAEDELKWRIDRFEDDEVVIVSDNGERRTYTREAATV